MGESYDICLLELWAAYTALRTIVSAPQNLLVPFRWIYLLIDNKPVAHWIAGKAKTAQTYYSKILSLIYRCVDRLFTDYQIRCTVQWCRRGFWFGNEQADKMAKLAAKLEEFGGGWWDVALCHGPCGANVCV